MTFKLWGRKVRSVAAQPWAAGLGATDAPQATNRSKKVVPVMDDLPVTNGIAVSSFLPVLMRQAISALPSSASMPRALARLTLRLPSRDSILSLTSLRRLHRTAA